MLLENAYVIDGKELQADVEDQLEMMVYSYSRYKETKKEADYRRYKIHKVALLHGLRWQGNDYEERCMIISYALDTVNVETRD